MGAAVVGAGGAIGAEVAGGFWNDGAGRGADADATPVPAALRCGGGGAWRCETRPGRLNQVLDRHQLAQMNPSQQRHLEVVPWLRRATDVGFGTGEQIEGAQ